MLKLFDLQIFSLGAMPNEVFCTKYDIYFFDFINGSIPLVLVSEGRAQVAQ